ncbi:hypothetical protein M432DRAFT_642949 [Thermoascus aurantiacus ATCC 26904]
MTAVKHDESVDALQKHATSVDRENLILRRQRKSLLASKLASRIYHQRKDLDDDIVIQRHFQSKQLSYIFGVCDIDLGDVRNGITLEWIYADALDAGEIVFVPITQERSKQLEWKFVVVNRRAVTFEMENYSDMWKFIDGRTLTFLNDNRPAAR